MAVTGDNVAPLYLLETLIDSYASMDDSVIDLHVAEALETTRRLFAAEAQGRTFQPRLGDERVRELFFGLRGAGEMLLGRASADIDDRRTEPAEPMSIDTLVRCLKQLERSVKLLERARRKKRIPSLHTTVPPQVKWRRRLTRLQPTQCRSLPSPKCATLPRAALRG
jgi:hypothetical protein